MIKRQLASWVIALAGLMVSAMPVAAAGSTTVDGTVPLVTRNMVVSDVGYYRATISWQTNGPADSQVEYGTTVSYGLTTSLATDLVTSHTVHLAGLTSATTYHFRVKSSGTGGTAVSPDYTFATLSVPSGGGGAPPPPPPALITSTGLVNWTPTATDVTPATIVVTSPDNKSTVTIAEMTLARDNQGNPLTTVTCNPPAVPAPAPPDRNIVAVYDMGPSGATFSVPITVTMKYDPVSLPAGAVESSLILAFYNATTGTWIPLDNIMVDMVNHTVSGTTNHFTEFAVLSSIVRTPTPTMPTPTTPTPTTPTATPTPTMPTPTTPTPTTPTATPTPTLAPTPTPVPTPAPALNWALIIGITAAVLVVGLIVYFVVIRRRP